MQIPLRANAPRERIASSHNCASTWLWEGVYGGSDAVGSCGPLKHPQPRATLRTFYLSLWYPYIWKHVVTRVVVVYWPENCEYGCTHFKIHGWIQRSLSDSISSRLSIAKFFFVGSIYAKSKAEMLKVFNERILSKWMLQIPKSHPSTISTSGNWGTPCNNHQRRSKHRPSLF